MKKGFTLIELIAIMIILAAMSLIAVTSYNTIIKNTEVNKEKDIVRNIIMEANVLYNDYVLKDKQDQLTNKNIYDLMTIDSKPNDGTLIINEYGNVAIIVTIENRCYKKTYDSNQVNLVEEKDCNLDYSTTDFDNPIVELEILGTKYNSWYSDNTYIKITTKDSGSGIDHYKWCLGIDCTPNNKETKNKVIAVSDTQGTQLCVIATDKANHTTNKTCTNTIKVDTTKPNLTINTTVTENSSRQDFTLNAIVATNTSGYTYEWYKDGTKLSDSTSKYNVSSTGTYSVRVISGSGKIEVQEIEITKYDTDINNGKIYASVIGTMNEGETCVLKGKYSEYTKEIPYDATTCTMDIANNLVLNGDLEYKSNKSLTRATYDTTNKILVFPSSGNGLYGFGEIIKIDSNKTYKQTMTLKASAGTSLNYLGLIEYDCNYETINPQYVSYIEGSTTRLAQDLKNGDTVIYLEDVSGFKVNASTPSHQLGLTFWNYNDCNGNPYGVEVYSRNSWANLFDYTSINLTNNTITLKQPWSNGTFEKGTSLSQRDSGANYNYGLKIGNIPTEYTTYTNTISQYAPNNINKVSNFRNGTVYVRPLVWLNADSAGYTNATVYIKEVSLEIID